MPHDSNSTMLLDDVRPNASAMVCASVCARRWAKRSFLRIGLSTKASNVEMYKATNKTMDKTISANRFIETPCVNVLHVVYDDVERAYQAADGVTNVESARISLFMNVTP